MNTHSLCSRPPETLVELILQRERLGGQLAFRYLREGVVDGPTDELTYGQLAQRARVIGGVLQGELREGSRVLLLYPSGLDFLLAFLGAQLGGVIPVPVYPPDPSRLERSLERLRGIVADCAPQVVLTTRAIKELAGAMLSGDPLLGSLRWLATDDLPEAGGGWRHPDLSGGALSFLQYTSGSTGSPKGVMVTHQNLLANLAQIEAIYRLGARSVGVFWLPHYHDMGLIGGILQALHGGYPLTFLSPLDFLRRPIEWLRALSRYRGTASGAPNFAYEHCVRKIKEEDKSGLELSAWEVAINGAEPLRAETIEAFYQAFRGCGLRRETMTPSYGLAEATLYVTGKPHLSAPRVLGVEVEALRRGEVAPSSASGAVALVSCGVPAPGLSLQILDAAGAMLPEGRVGALCIAGPNVTQGYWEKAPESFVTIGRASYLRTGDLGFLYEGELYITGRQKDLIIQSGQNLYPQDLERTAERLHPALRPGCAAAFSVAGELTESVVLLLELDGRWEGALSRGEAAPVEGAITAPEELCALIQAALSAQHEVALSALWLVSAGSLPKTPSGKIQRHACREGFLGGAITPLFAWRAGELSGPASERALIYEDLSAHFAKLDRRNTRYRYDLERDICWEEMKAPGLHFGDRYFKAARLKGERLREHPEVHSLFQWALGVTVSDRFVSLEEFLLRFSSDERALLGPTRSLELLDEEEIKHIETFRRYSQHLRALRPGEAAEVDRSREAYEQLLSSVFDPLRFSSRAQYHYTFWLFLLVFECYTVWLNDLLSEDSIQPTWRAMNKAHAQEEVQHIRTDLGYLAGLRATEEERFAWSKAAYEMMHQEVTTLLSPFVSGLELCQLRHPGSQRLLEIEASEEPWLVWLFRQDLFASSLGVAPYIAYLLERGADKPSPRAAHEAEGTSKALAWIAEWLASSAAVPRRAFDPAKSFTQYGLDSVRLVSLSGDLGHHFGRRLSPTAGYDYPTPRRLAEHLSIAPEDSFAPLRLSRPGPLPLAARQARLWRLAQAHPGQILDHITTIRRLSAPQEEALRQALSLVASRHEGLRASFRLVEGEPALFLVSAEVPLTIRRSEARTEAQWLAELQQLAASQDLSPFDLAQGVWRATLLLGPEDEGALVLTVHHIVTDGWSTELLWRELSGLYEALAQGRAARSPLLPSQFAEVAAREAQQLATENTRAKLDWWRERIGGHLQRLEAPAKASYGAAHGGVSAAVVRRLSTLASQRGVSLYIALLTAFTQQQQRLQQEADILVNTHLFNRSTEEERAMVGYFVNLLTLRPELPLGASFKEALRRLRLAWVEALENALPIDFLMHELAPGHYCERVMPSRVAFNLLSLSMSREPQSTPAIFQRCAAQEPPPGFMFFDQMMVAALKAEGGLSVTLWYNREVLPPSGAAQLVADFCRSLEEIAGHS